MAREMAHVVMAAEGICVEYRALDRIVPAVEDVAVTIVAGSLTVIAGPSGSGKSSLLRVLGLLDRPTRGVLKVEGVDALAMSDRERRRLRRGRLAYVHQRPVSNLVDDLTAVDQVAFAVSCRGSALVDAHSVLDAFGLGQRTESRPADLSGGEQQRLAIAMAAACDPAVMFADEPTSALDRHHADEVIEALVEAASGGRAVVVASHDPGLIAAATHLLRLRDGRVEVTDA
jgi:ABC-type lipoprotein export system ATPase subunit